MDRTQCIIIGAGVIGLAIGRAIALSGREVIILEAESEIGTHTSSRNSEVIHAGIYYPVNSLKALLCVSGREQLYKYCKKKGINHRRTGKLIVATQEHEKNILFEYKKKAELNGVHDIRLITEKEAKELEPKIECHAALLSPSTGIIDSHEYMLALRADFENAGGHIVCDSRATMIDKTSKGFTIEISGEQGYAISCETLINTAGLWAPGVARLIKGIKSASIPDDHFARGHYFTLSGKTNFQHLVYPVASQGGLGIHLTLDLSGHARFGPDVEWISDIDYSFNASKATFIRAIQSYYPDIEPERLTAGYTGIRPKLGGPETGTHDFVIQTAADHQMTGLINLFGMESPGLTASLAIADKVKDLL